MHYPSVSTPLRLTIEEAINMVNITNKDWTEFVAEVRSRLDVVDANIENSRLMSDTQHKQQRDDFLSLKKELTGSHSGSMASRVRSLEDTRTKMNGVQLGISAAFSVVTAGLAWVFGHPGMHLTWHALSIKLYAMVDWFGGFFRRS